MNRIPRCLLVLCVALMACSAAHASPESEAFARKYYADLRVHDMEGETSGRTLVFLHQEVPDALKADVLADLIAMDEVYLTPKSIIAAKDSVLAYLAADWAKNLAWNERLRVAVFTRGKGKKYTTALLPVLDHLDENARRAFIQECLTDKDEWVRVKTLESLQNKPGAKAQFQAYVEANKDLPERQRSVSFARKLAERAP